MRKEIFLCGFLAVAGVSADVNLNIVETETREAVSNILSGLYAQAQDIQYSFLEKKLVLTGVEYAVPDGDAVRRGKIERVELAGFDRAALQAPAAGEEYSPEKLPRVAESVTLQGLTETMQSPGESVSWSMAAFEGKGWYQRIGALIAAQAAGSDGLAFYEEMLRCSMDQAVIKDLSMKIDAPEEAAASISIASVEYPGGIKAPEASGKPHPLSALLSGVAFESDGVKGTVQSMELASILPPSAAQLKELAALAGLKDGEDKALAEFFRKAWSDEPPFSRLALNGMRIFMGDKETASTELVACAINYQDGGWKSDFDIKALRISPDVMGDEKGVIARRAPGGMAFDCAIRASASESGSTLDMNLDVNGLGVLKSSSAYSVNIFKRIAELATAGEDLDLDLLRKDCAPQSAKFSYKDSGLAALLADISMDGNLPDLALEKLLLAVNYLAGKEYAVSFDMAGLKIPAMALEMSGCTDIISRFAPQGVSLDAKTDVALTSEKGHVTAGLNARGLGKLDFGLFAKADFMSMLKQALETGDLSDEMAGQIEITGAQAAYKDSGLLPLGASIGARFMEMQPMEIVNMAKAQAEGWAGSENAFYAKLGAMLREQLEHPGEMAVQLVLQVPMALMELAGAAMGDPSALPLEFTSRAGEKSMEEWLN